MNDTQLIQAIAKRAGELYVTLAIIEPKQEYFVRTATAVELSMVHREIIPLRLQELLDADDGNFAHDVGGIHRHLEIGEAPKLTGCFCPRFAVV